MILGLMSIVVLAWAGMAGAQAPETFDLVGQDSAEDFGYTLGGVEEPSGVFGEGKVDILSLEMVPSADTLHVRLNIGASYQGMGGHMFVVWFDSAGATYFTCWNIQTAGTTTNSQDVAENVFGCSYFVGFTQAGPATKAAGVEQKATETGAYVHWPVPLADIGAAEGLDLANVRAETYARTGSTSNAGSTTHQEYQWHRQDVAPDEGTWTYAPGGATGGGGGEETASLMLDLVLDKAETALGPGMEASVNATVRLADATANVTDVPIRWEAADVPEGWVAAWDPETATLTGPDANATSTLRVTIPASAANGTYPLTLRAASEGDLNVTALWTVVVDAALAPATTSPGLNETNAAPLTASDNALPSAGFGLSLLAAAGVAAVARGRFRAR